MTANLIPTPNPMGFVIELENCTLTVVDLNKPIWHGTYHSGVLSIYKTEVAGENIADGDTYVSVFTEHGGPEFAMYASYKIEVPVEDVVQHLLANVFEAYKNGLTAVVDTPSKTVH